jgi:preprotein translocase subunit SecD
MEGLAMKQANKRIIIGVYTGLAAILVVFVLVQYVFRRESELFGPASLTRTRAAGDKRVLHLVLEMETETLLGWLAVQSDSLLEGALNEARRRVKETGAGWADALQQAVGLRGGSLAVYYGMRGRTDDQIKEYLDSEIQDAVKLAEERIKKRLLEYGVMKFDIELLPPDRIELEIPVFKDDASVSRLITKGGYLTFHLVEPRALFEETLVRIDEFIAGKHPVGDDSGAAMKDTDTSPEESEETISGNQEVSVEDLFGSTVDAWGSAGGDSVIVDRDAVRNHPFLALLRDLHREVAAPLDNMKAISAILENPDIQKLIPAGTQILWGAREVREGDQSFRHLYLVEKNTDLTGRFISEANLEIGSDALSSGMPEVHFTLNRAGARILRRVTGANIGERLAIVLDKRVITAPRISMRLDARCRITGISTMEEAKELEILLRVGALPAPFRVVEER